MNLLVWQLLSTVCMQNVNPTSGSILISLLLSHRWLSYFFPWLKRFILNIWQPCWNSGCWKWISLIHVLLMKDVNVNPSRVLLFPENHSNSGMILKTILEMAGSYLHNLNNSSCKSSHSRFCQEGEEYWEFHYRPWCFPKSTQLFSLQVAQVRMSSFGNHNYMALPSSSMCYTWAPYAFPLMLWLFVLCLHNCLSWMSDYTKEVLSQVISSSLVTGQPSHIIFIHSDFCVNCRRCITC